MAPSTPAAYFRGPLTAENAKENEAIDFWYRLFKIWDEGGPEAFFGVITDFFAPDVQVWMPGGHTWKGLPNVMGMMGQFLGNYEATGHDDQALVVWSTETGYEVWEESIEYYTYKKGDFDAKDLPAPTLNAVNLNRKDRKGKTWDIALPWYNKRIMTKTPNGLRMTGYECIFDESVLQAEAERRGLVYPVLTPA